MIPNNQKTSLLIPSQLPEFIRDDPSYSNFVSFLQTYYEWLETSGNVTDTSKNILNYTDIDNTSSQFAQYFYNEFLQYFPQDVLADRSRVVKIAKELYKSKGTPSSFKFLFRILYNIDVDFFFTRDVVFKASSGKWYVTNSLNVQSTDTNLLYTQNLRVFGETTQSIAIIENVRNNGNKMEIFVSNIERQFVSGENIKIIDTNNQDVYFLNGQIVPMGTIGGYVLTGKIVGQINNLSIINPGSKYQVGDPIVFYNGLTSPTGIGASATVSAASSGSVESISVINGGYGYNNNAVITISATNATTEPLAKVFNLDAIGTANATFIPSNYINSGNLMSVKLNSVNYCSNSLNFPTKIVCNSNTPLVNAFSFLSYSTSPISSLTVVSGGVGIQSISSISATSVYPTSNTNYFADLKNLGILSPIQILNGGIGYRNNDTIIISGGPGFGAYANVISVNPANSNTIVEISYVYSSNTKSTQFPLGGMGYKSSRIPTASVNSSNVSAHGAVLSIPGILGTGATFQSTVSGIGKITSVNITNFGQDYTSIPSISLAVQDIIVNNVDMYNLPVPGDLIFQSPDDTYANANYFSYFDSIVPVSISSNPANSTYRLRVYNYNSSSNLIYGRNLFDNNNGSSFTISNYNLGRFVRGILTYGDGTATAVTKFTNGSTSSQGQYIDTSGQPSGSDVLQSNIYNNFTYQVLVQKEIEKYRKTLLGLLHPAGMRVLGRYTLSSSNDAFFNIEQALYSGHTLSYYMGTTGVPASMVTNFNNPSNNIITFTSVPVGTNIADIFFANTSTIRLSSNTGDRISSLVVGVDYVHNQITLQTNTWLTFINVAYVSAIANTSAINILSLTGTYSYYNDGEYSNTSYPMMDIIRVGDTILVSNNPSKIVTSVDYINNIAYVNSIITNNAIGMSSNISVIRPFVTNSAAHIQIFGPTGVTYVPELITENGFSLTTEDGNIILLG